MIENKPVDLPRQDPDLVREPEDMRRDLAEGFSRNLYSFCTGVLGYRDLTEEFHGQLCAWHDGNGSRFKLTLAPRGHLKTTCLGIGKPLQRIVQNPENRILIANETATNSERMLGAIKTHADTNRMFRTLYGHLIPPEGKNRPSWSQTELTFKREGVYTVPSIDTIGMTGAMTSRHYTHLTIDDPISLEAARSKLTMEDVIARISTLLSLMDDPEHDSFDLTGTRWAFYDVYSHFMEWFGDRLAKYIRAAIEDGKPVWPERFSMETLALIRNDPQNGEYMFSCLYMNNPRNVEVQDFNIQDIKFWKWGTDEESLVLFDREGGIEEIVPLEDLDITVTVDLRYGEKTTSDRDAVVTAGTTPSGKAIFLDTYAKRGTPLDVIDQLVYVIRRYQPRAIGIQKAGYEMSLKWHLLERLEREGLYANVVPVRPGGPGKPHIRGLQPVAATGRMFILPTMHILRSELADYPLGRNDDVADAAALQTQLWRGILSPTRMAKYKESEKRLLRSLRQGTEVRMLRPGLTPAQLEDEGYDPEQGRYGDFEQVDLKV